MNWTANLVPLAPFVMIIFIVLFASMRQRAQDRNRTEMQKDLLTKFSSAQELVEFMKSDGAKLLMPVPERPRTPASRAGTGVFIVVVGFGLLAASMFTTPADIHGGLQVAGLLAVAAGIGFLISAIVTQKLSRKWGEEEGKTAQ
jgi:predicted phage tail protein